MTQYTITEASITIEGTRLNWAQSNVVRQAVSGMLTQLADPAFLADLGEIGPLYRARLGEVQRLIFSNL